MEAVGDKCDDWEKEHAELSDGGIEEMPKSWRNMYNVMNLYRILHDEDYSAMDATSPSSPPCKFNTFLNLSIFHDSNFGNLLKKSHLSPFLN